MSASCINYAFLFYYNFLKDTLYHYTLSNQTKEYRNKISYEIKRIKKIKKINEYKYILYIYQ